MNDDMECPYCGEGQEVCHDDGEGYDEDVLHEHECSKCGKSFTFSTTIIFYYESHKADCLNDGNHDYQPTKTYPKECTRMECTTCDARRQPTPEEWVKINAT